MSKTSEEVAYILNEIYNDNFSGKEGLRYLISSDDIRKLYGLSRLHETRLVELMAAASDEGIFLLDLGEIPGGRTFAVIKHQAINRWRKVSKKIIANYAGDQSYSQDGDEYVDTDVQYSLAVMYQSGLGVKQDYHKAFKWHEKAALQGHVLSQFNLGLIYQNGYGIPQDYKKAFEWYEKAAEQGNAEAQACLGAMYSRGEGVTQDDKKAFEWFEKAEKQILIIGDPFDEC